MTSYSLIIFHETAYSFLVGREPGDRETEACFWLPKSEVELGPTVMKAGIEWGQFEIPDWIAEDRGLDESLDGDLFE